MIEVKIPITYESSDYNKLFVIYLDKCNSLFIDFNILRFDMFKTILDVKGKVELQGKYIFQLTQKGE